MFDPTANARRIESALNVRPTRPRYNYGPRKLTPEEQRQASTITMFEQLADALEFIPRHLAERRAKAAAEARANSPEEKAKRAAARDRAMRKQAAEIHIARERAAHFGPIWAQAELERHERSRREIDALVRTDPEARIYPAPLQFAPR